MKLGPAGCPHHQIAGSETAMAASTTSLIALPRITSPIAMGAT